MCTALVLLLGLCSGTVGASGPPAPGEGTTAAREDGDGPPIDHLIAPSEAFEPMLLTRYEVRP